MMNDVECSSINQVERTDKFTNSNAFNFASAVGIFYVMLLPFELLLMFSFYFIYMVTFPFPGALLHYFDPALEIYKKVSQGIVICSYVVFALFFIKNAPIKEKHCFIKNKVLSWFGFGVFITGFLFQIFALFLKFLGYLMSEL